MTYTLQGNSCSKLDVGGLIVTVIRLFSDIRFITRVKEEFIESQLDIHFNGIMDEIEKMNYELFSAE